MNYTLLQFSIGSDIVKNKKKSFYLWGETRKKWVNWCPEQRCSLTRLKEADTSSLKLFWEKLIMFLRYPNYHVGGVIFTFIFFLMSGEVFLFFLLFCPPCSQLCLPPPLNKSWSGGRYWRTPNWESECSFHLLLIIPDLSLPTRNEFCDLSVLGNGWGRGWK